MVALPKPATLLSLTFLAGCISNNASHGLSSTPKASLKAEWTELLTNTISPPRSGHVAFVTAAPEKGLYVFGGYAEDAEMKRDACDDLWKWNSVEPGWEQVRRGGSYVPGSRLAAAAATVGSKPTLFGGWDPQVAGTGGIILDTVDQFDPLSNTWKRLKAKIPDGPSSRHVALGLVDNLTCMIHNHRCTDHVILFDGTDGTFRKRATGGAASPSSRGLHAGTMMGEKAVLFGGAAQDGIMSNDVFVLDTILWEWIDVKVTGKNGTPTPRAGPCLCTLSNDCAIMFGGAESTEGGLNARADLWALRFSADWKKAEWELMLDDANGPPPRNGATLTAMDCGLLGEEEVGVGGETKKCFLLQGGWSPFQKTWEDNFVLTVNF